MTKQIDLFTGSEMENLKRLQELNQNLNKLIGQIESDMRRREYTENTLAMIEDALAITIDIIIHDRQQSEWREGRIRKLLTVLQIGRQGPYAYPKNPDSGNLTLWMLSSQEDDGNK